MDNTAQDRQTLLNWTDQAVRDVIGRTEAIVNKPTREWTVEERMHSMELLATTVERALARFNTWLDVGVWINSAGGIVGSLQSIWNTAKHATFGVGSRCWGRTYLKQDLTRLRTLFGDGCSFQTEPIVLQGGNGLPKDDLARPGTSVVVSPNARLYTINELAALHSLSRNSIIRLYQDEPGVQVLQASRGHQRKIGRRYRTIRVPRHVYLRVKSRMENK